MAKNIKSLNYIQGFNKVKSLSGLLDNLKLTKTRKLGIPLNVHIEITARCNFKCVHCQVTHTPGELTYRTICSVIDQLADIGSFHLVVSGGEPLIRPDFLKILSHARKRDFAITLNTNASLITEEIAKRLADLSLLQASVSIYGMDEPTYKSVTGVSGAFEKVLRAVNSLVLEEVPVNLRMVLLRENFAQFREFEKFAQKLGVRYYPIFEIRPRFDRCQRPFKHSLSISQLKKFFMLFPQYCAPAMKSVPSASQGACGGGLDIIAINSKGEVMPCAFLRNHTTIREKPIAEILRTDPLFIRVNKLRWRDLPKCLKCKALVYCRACPGCLTLETGSLVTPAPQTKCKVAWLKKRIYEEYTKNTSAVKTPRKN